MMNQRTSLKRGFLFLFIFLGWLNNFAFSQMEGAHWYFGSYAGLDFTSGTPVPVFDGKLNTSEGCSSISDKFGNLLFYTDGSTVYDKNHNIMPNGTGLLGHSSSAMSSVVCPKPGTWNPIIGRYDGYIICTIDYEGGSNGVRWSEVDMTANGGNGQVVVATKNTHLIDTRTVEAANFAVHQNGCDYWLITKEIYNNTWKVFPVTSAGVGATPVVSSQGPITNPTWGSIKVSPDSETVAMVGNSSRLCVLDFNRTTGQLVQKYTHTTIPSTYSIEFSPSGRFLYMSCLNDANIYQFDLAASNQIDFSNSATIVGATTNTVHAYKVGSLQLGPDGKIYMALINTTYLGVINYPNLLGTASSYQDFAVNIGGTNIHNGLPTRAILGLPSFPNFLFKEPKQILATQLCNSFDLAIGLSDYDDLVGQDWFVTPHGTAYPSTPNSTDPYLVMNNLPIGQYDIKVFLDYGCYSDIVERTVTVAQYNEINLGDDICYSDGMILDASPNFDSYLWQDGSTNSTFSPTMPGTYHCTVGTFGENLIYNGDFELGNIGFTSGYVYDGTGNINQGRYYVGTSILPSWWSNCPDHTSGSGNMFILDADCTTGGSGTPGNNFWCQSVSVMPNTDYIFKVYIGNSHGGANTPTVGLNIDGTLVDSYSAAVGACTWQEFSYVWNSGIQTTVNLCLNELTGECGGNDFQIDDISFSAICYDADTIVVKPLPNAVISGTSGGCSPAELPEIIVEANNSVGPYSVTYTIDNGAGQTITVSNTDEIITAPSTPGEYLYHFDMITDSGTPNCSQSINQNIYVTVADFTFDISEDDTICLGESSQLYVNAPGALEINWTPDPSLDATDINNPVATPTVTTSYEVKRTYRIGANLVENGDFEQGNTGFNTDYNNSPSNGAMGGQGYYSVGQGITNGWYAGCNDHTSGSGNMLIVDCAAGVNGVPVGANIWCQTITVEPNTDYAFSTWLAYAYNNGSTSSLLQFFINGSQVGPTQVPPPGTCNWEEFYAVWNSGSNTTAQICISEASGISSGNDFALDDISFYKLCELKDTVIVVVNPLPVADFTFVNACDNEAVQLTSTSTTMNGGFMNYYWDIDDNGTTDYTNNPTEHTYGSDGFYDVTLIVKDNEGCMDTITKQITVYTLPVADFDVTFVCEDETTQFTNTSTINSTNGDVITTYNWSFGDNSTSILENPTHDYGTENIYSAQLIVATNNGCQDTIIKSVEVYPLPSVSFSPTDVCLDFATSFSDLSTVSNQHTSNQNVGWQWDFGEGGTSDLQNPNYTYSLDGTYSASLTVTTNHGCEVTASVPLHVWPNPVVDFIGSNLKGCATLCPSVHSISTVNSPSTLTNYKWTLSNGAVFQGSSPNFTDCFDTHSTDKSYDVTLEVTTDKGCVNVKTIPSFIEVYHNPIADFSYSPEEPTVVNSEVQFQNQSSYANSYYWVFDMPNGYTLGEANPKVILPYDKGELATHVTLIASTDKGCTDTSKVVIVVRDEVIFYIPNTFTPDGTPYNETFFPVFASGIQKESYVMTIYNRWGELLFETHDLDEGWDGTYGGKVCEFGTYVWRIEFIDRSTDNSYYYTGHVNLIR